MARVSPDTMAQGAKVRPAQLSRVKPTDRGMDLQEVWTDFDSGGRMFFSTMDFAKDGGFSEVKGMFTLDRYFWALVQLLCVVLNLGYILQTNLKTLIDNNGHFLVDMNSSTRHLFINFLIGLVIEGDKRLSSHVLLAFLELLFLAFHVARFGWIVISYVRGSDVERWHALARLVWDIVPDLGSFSAMKSLYFVTPKVFMPTCILHTKWALTARDLRSAWDFLVFLVSRIFYAFIGIEAFMIKFCVASEEHARSESFVVAFIVACAFLNQLLGVVDVNKFAQRRLFTFVFGGEDSFLSRYEEIVSQTWMAMLAQKIWEAAKEHRVPVLWFFAVGLSYGDSDFQRLTLEICARKKRDADADEGA